MQSPSWFHTKCSSKFEYYSNLLQFFFFCINFFHIDRFPNYQFSCSFIQCFDRLLLYDLSSYAIQLIAGANKFPGPTIRLLGSAITVCVLNWINFIDMISDFLMADAAVNFNLSLEISWILSLKNRSKIKFQYHINENFSQIQLSGWIQLLCCKRPTQWNTDKSTLYLLGILVRLAFVRDQTKLLGIPKLLKANYAVLLQVKFCFVEVSEIILS